MARIDVASQYIVNLQGQADAAATECAMIALSTDSGEEIEIVRVRVSIRSPSSVDAYRVRFLRTSDIGTGSTSGTAIKKDPSFAASQTTVNIKNGITDWLISGVTVIDAIDDTSFVGRSMLEWTAVDQDDKIIINNGDKFIVSLNPSTNSAELFCCTIEWKEE